MNHIYIHSIYFLVISKCFPQALENMENGRKNFHAWKNNGIGKLMINHGKIMEVWYEIAFLMPMSLKLFLLALLAQPFKKNQFFIFQ